MKKNNVLLGIVVLFFSLLVVSCGNSPKSDAKKAAEMAEQIIELRIDYNDGEITKTEYREKKDQLRAKGKAFMKECEENYNPGEMKEFEEEVNRLEKKIEKKYEDKLGK